MNTYTVAAAGEKLLSLIDEVRSTHRPITIHGKNGNAVLLGEEDWNAAQEMIYLLSSSGMGESIQEGMKEDLNNCSKELDWE